MCLMPSTDSASTMALTPADSEPTVPASPAPFTTERIGRRRHRVVLDHHRTEVVRPRHGVVHERAGEHLPGLVIGFVLYQHLTQALGDAAHDLSLDQHWVDHGA